MLKPRLFPNHRLDVRPKSVDALFIRAHPCHPWFPAAFAVLLVAESLAAEAVTATGTVEAVDVQAGTITVRRKTASGEKTATLKVAADAEVLTHGEAIELGSLAKGDEIELTYGIKPNQS